MVALEGIENILRVGDKDAKENGGSNKYADFVEECHGGQGLDNIETLQRHDNEEIYAKAVAILQNYFDSVEEDDATLAPQVDANANQFQFGGNLPQANAPFNFGN
jgi:importin subunit alpha-2